MCLTIIEEMVCSDCSRPLRTTTKPEEKLLQELMGSEGWYSCALSRAARDLIKYMLVVRRAVARAGTGTMLGYACVGTEINCNRSAVNTTELNPATIESRRL